MASRTTGWTAAFAVLRLDDLGSPSAGFLDGTGLTVGAGGSSVTVKEIVCSREEAEREVRRLNDLNAENGCRYYWQGTHLCADGESFGSSADEAP